MPRKDLDDFSKLVLNKTWFPQSPPLPHTAPSISSRCQETLREWGGQAGVNCRVLCQGPLSL